MQISLLLMLTNSCQLFSTSSQPTSVCFCIVTKHELVKRIVSPFIKSCWFFVNCNCHSSSKSQSHLWARIHQFYKIFYIKFDLKQQQHHRQVNVRSKIAMLSIYIEIWYVFITTRTFIKNTKNQMIKLQWYREMLYGWIWDL